MRIEGGGLPGRPPHSSHIAPLLPPAKPLYASSLPPFSPLV